MKLVDVNLVTLTMLRLKRAFVVSTILALVAMDV